MDQEEKCRGEGKQIGTGKDELSFLERIEYVEPGPKAKAIIEMAGTSRGVPKSNLRKHDGMCAWCEIRQAQPGPQRKYCSKNCNESALFNCYPQHVHSKGFILIEKQQCACARCGQSFEEVIKERIRKRLKIRESYKTHWPRAWKNPIEYWEVMSNTGHIWHVDHIIPVHKGGAGCGIDNVQVLCVQCHKEKTKEDVQRTPTQ